MFGADLKAQSRVSFPAPDGGHVHAALYNGGEHAGVLAHGGHFTKESWAVDVFECVERFKSLPFFRFRTALHH